MTEPKLSQIKLLSESFRFGAIKGVPKQELEAMVWRQLILATGGFVVPGAANQERQLTIVNSLFADITGNKRPDH